MQTDKDRRADAAQEDKTNEAGKPPRKGNWVTDIYDKMNVSVRTLDILIVVLCALIVILFVFGNRLG